MELAVLRSVREFQTNNALLRNAGIHLPRAAADAVDALEPGQRTRFEAAVFLTLSYAVVGDDASATAAARALDALAGEALPPRADTALRQARLLLEAKPRADSLSLAAFDARAELLLGDLHLSLSAHYRRRHELAGLFAALAATSLLSAGVLALLGALRLRKTNHSLEAQVRERTAELEESQTKLLVADRLASAGRLAAGIAHEINNPLAYVLGNVHFAVGEIGGLSDPRLEPTLEALREAKEGAERVASIVKGMRAYSRESTGQRTSVDVNHVVREVLHLVQSQAKTKARLVHSPGAVDPVEADEVQLGQVVMNLLVNAIGAIPEGEPDANEVRIATCMDRDGRVRLEITDTGSGIPATVRARLFEPFFTTKDVGEGTGLGLYISQGIVRAHGGEITIDSHEGAGTTVRILLPAATAGHDATRPARPAIPTAVLLIDDDPLVRKSLARMLKGHTVACASSAEEALGWIAGGAQFGVVLCDLSMPGMDGADCYAKIQSIAPELARRVHFLTGGALTPKLREFEKSHQSRIAYKPITSESLEGILHALTDAR